MYTFLSTSASEPISETDYINCAIEFVDRNLGYRKTRLVLLIILDTLRHFESIAPSSKPRIFFLLASLSFA